MGSIAILLLFFAFGFLLRQRLSEPRRQRWALRLNRYVVFVALPALILVYLPGLKLDRGTLLPILSAWGLFALTAALVLLAARIGGWSRGITGALLFTVPFGNTSFLGVPFTQAFYGEAGLPYTLIYDQLGSFLILSTVGIFLLSLYTGRSFSPLAILLRILRFPAFSALLIALFLDRGDLPAPLHLLAAGLAATLAPAAMVAVGLQIRLRFPRHEQKPFLFALGVKLLLAPLFLLLLFAALGLTDLAARVSIFEASMAPMVASSTLAILAGLESGFVASVLGYGILASFITVPTVWMMTEWLLG